MLPVSKDLLMASDLRKEKRREERKNIEKDEKL